ncbi:4-alpha-glucanotransferase [Streptomyces thinghirensis]|nr:4-alpha-glucanotransferase [Streptomyces thinghirensis]
MPAARPAEPPTEDLPEDLTRLAALHGVATCYSPSPDRTVAASATAVTLALAALGVDTSTPEAVRAALAARESVLGERLLPPTVVAWSDGGTPAALAALPEGTRLRVDTEQGETRDGAGGLPAGVHRLAATVPDGRTALAHLIVAPARLPVPATRSYGLLVQLLLLLSRRSWGMGDLGDLGELAAWAGRALGAGFVQVNPLHACRARRPDRPLPVPALLAPLPRPGPPADRGRARVRVRHRPRSAPGPSGAGRTAARGRAGEGRPDRPGRRVGAEARGPRTAPRGPLGPGRRAAYCDYLAEQGTALEDHATWCALAEVHGSDWHRWPEGLRDPRSAETDHARTELMDRVDFHTRLTWLTDTQLTAAQRTAREAGMPVGIVHDLAVGVHPRGADAWAQQGVLRRRHVGGRAPDAFNARGQDWGLPPWRPDRLAESGYAPFRSLLRGLFRYAGALRIDHVMGLFRLWWVPEGHPPTEGTYVRYDAEAMLAVLVLEAARAGAVVIGEDLGTVEPGGARGAARTRGARHLRAVVRARLGGRRPPPPPERWRADCLATATTHDLPSTAARLTGEHVELRDRLGLLTRPLEEERAEASADTAEWLDVLARLGLLHGTGGDTGTPSEEAGIQAVHRFLLRTPARMAGIWLPDAVGDRRPQNLPGTWDQYPNWRLPVADAEGRPVTLEDLAASARLHALIDVVRDRRRRLSGPPPDRSRPSYGTPGARPFRPFANFAPWTRRTPCAPAPWQPVRR